MKRLHTLTLKYYIGPFVATFFICLFVLLMQFLWKYVDELVGKGLELHVISELMFYAAVQLIPMALPLAILLSSMMTFGNLAENHELMAFKSAGISLLKVMRPLIALVILISIGAFYLSNNLIPKANLKFASLLWDIRKQKPALDIKPGIFYDEIEDYAIRIGSKNEEGNIISDVLIYDHSSGSENNVVIKAKSGEMYTTEDEKFMILKLFDGTRYEEVKSQKGRNDKKQNFPHSKMAFKEYDMRFDLSEFKLNRSDESLFKDHYKMLTVGKLNKYIDSVQVRLNEKQAKMSKYFRGYFFAYKDSNFALSDTLSFDTVNSSNYIEHFDSNERKGVLKRALSNARSVKGVAKQQGRYTEQYQRNIARYNIEWHRKFVLSVACLILFFIGAPLGAIIRKGGLGMPAVVSVILFIIYHVISITGEKFAKQHVIEPFIGMWMPVFILFPVGLIITYLASRDSRILTKEIYTQFFSKLADLITRPFSRSKQS